MESAGAHAASEFKNYQVGSTEASVDNYKRTALLNPGDPEIAKTSIDKINADAEHMGQLKGWSPEQVTDYKSKHISDMNYNRVVTIARNDPMAAQKTLEQIQQDGGIDGEKAGVALTFIRGQRNGVMSRVEAGKLLSGEGTHFGNGVVPAARAREAIKGVESSGQYNLVHPDVTHKVGGKMVTEHALGAYGVMQSNLQPWLKEAGLSATEAEFLQNKDGVQDKLFHFKFGQYMAEHGSANKAAMVWFTGSPNPKADASDGNTTAPGYLVKFNKGLAKTAGPKDLSDAAMTRAKELAPDDPDFHYSLQERVFADHSRDRQIEVQEEFNNRHTVEAAVMSPDNFGKLPTSIEEIQDPAVREAWEKLPDWQQAKFNATLARNAKQEFAATPRIKRSSTRSTADSKTR